MRSLTSSICFGVAVLLGGAASSFATELTDQEAPSRHAVDAAPVRLVVATFDEHGTMPGLGSAVADLLIRAIDRDDIVLQERGQFRRVVEERRLAETDLVNRARELGQIEEARLVLVGSVYRLDDRYLLSARVVDLSARIQEGQVGSVIVRTIDELATAVELLAVQLGLRTAPLDVPPAMQLDQPRPSTEGNGASDAASIGDLVGAVAPANPFGLRMQLEPEAKVLEVGTPVRVRVEVERSGWLTLLVVDSRGLITPLVPNRVVPKFELKAGVPRTIPDELRFTLRAAPPAGLTRLRAIVTEKPIDLGRLEGEGATGVGVALSADRGLDPAVLEQLGGAWSTVEVEFAVREPRPALPTAGASGERTQALPMGADDRLLTTNDLVDASREVSASESAEVVSLDGETIADRGSADAARVSEGAAASRRSRLARSAAALALPAVEIAPNAPLDPSTWHLAEIDACPAAMGWSARLASLEPPLVAIVDAGFEFRDPRLEQAWKRDASGEVLVVDLVEARETDDRRGGFGTIAGHGHAVASLIAARRLETSPEVQGVLPKATLLPIVVAAAEPGPRWRTPRGHASTVLLALNAAADLGAKVVNVSLGVPVDRSELERLASDPVWDRLERDGVIVVCAAGNDGRDLDREPIFPASIDRPNVIAVAAHGPDGILMGHHVPAGESSGPRSGFGVRRVECSAPGEALVVATTRGRSELVEGTSYAAALVSAALAAAMAIEPDAKPERLLEFVTGSARIDTLEGLVSRGAVRLPSD